VDDQIIVRKFKDADAADVKRLFIKVNRQLAPVNLRAAFEAYISSSLLEEIGKISEYYAERKGGFWVATAKVGIVGMFGLEPSGPEAMELRRMYVDPDSRRQGIAGKMLGFAEDKCRDENFRRIDLSTSEIQVEALSFYRKSGYRLVREGVAEAMSNKTIGGGVRRYHFQKEL